MRFSRTVLLHRRLLHYSINISKQGEMIRKQKALYRTSRQKMAEYTNNESEQEKQLKIFPQEISDTLGKAS
jgi:uncharacterized protein (DUF2225 family)